jgi:hypothetical protein
VVASKKRSITDVAFVVLHPTPISLRMPWRRVTGNVAGRTVLCPVVIRFVCLTVPDGRVHLVIYGTAETIEGDPERAELTADVLAVVRGPGRPDPATIAGWLEQEQRRILRITPDKVWLHE